MNEDTCWSPENAGAAIDTQAHAYLRLKKQASNQLWFTTLESCYLRMLNSTVWKLAIGRIYLPNFTAVQWLELAMKDLSIIK